MLCQGRELQRGGRHRHLPREWRMRLLFVIVCGKPRGSWAVRLDIVMIVVGLWSSQRRPPLEVLPVGSPLGVVLLLSQWLEY